MLAKVLIPIQQANFSPRTFASILHQCRLFSVLGATNFAKEDKGHHLKWAEEEKRVIDLCIVLDKEVEKFKQAHSHLNGEKLIGKLAQELEQAMGMDAEDNYLRSLLAFYFYLVCRERPWIDNPAIKALQLLHLPILLEAINQVALHRVVHADFEKFLQAMKKGRSHDFSSLWEVEHRRKAFIFLRDRDIDDEMRAVAASSRGKVKVPPGASEKYFRECSQFFQEQSNEALRALAQRFFGPHVVVNPTEADHLDFLTQLFEIVKFKYPFCFDLPLMDILENIFFGEFFASLENINPAYLLGFSVTLNKLLALDNTVRFFAKNDQGASLVVEWDVFRPFENTCKNVIFKCVMFKLIIAEYHAWRENELSWDQAVFLASFPMDTIVQALQRAPLSDPVVQPIAVSAARDSNYVAEVKGVSVSQTAAQESQFLQRIKMFKVAMARRQQALHEAFLAMGRFRQAESEQKELEGLALNEVKQALRDWLKNCYGHVGVDREEILRMDLFQLLRTQPELHIQMVALRNFIKQHDIFRDGEFAGLLDLEKVFMEPFVDDDPFFPKFVARRIRKYREDGIYATRLLWAEPFAPVEEDELEMILILRHHHPHLDAFSKPLDPHVEEYAEGIKAKSAYFQGLSAPVEPSPGPVFRMVVPVLGEAWYEDFKAEMPPEDFAMVVEPSLDVVAVDDGEQEVEARDEQPLLEAAAQVPIVADDSPVEQQTNPAISELPNKAPERRDRDVKVSILLIGIAIAMSVYTGGISLLLAAPVAIFGISRATEMWKSQAQATVAKVLVALGVLALAGFFIFSAVASGGLAILPFVSGFFWHLGVAGGMSALGLLMCYGAHRVAQEERSAVQGVVFIASLFVAGLAGGIVGAFTGVLPAILAVTAAVALTVVPVYLIYKKCCGQSVGKSLVSEQQKSWLEADAREAGVDDAASTGVAQLRSAQEAHAVGVVSDTSADAGPDASPKKAADGIEINIDNTPRA